MIKNQNDAGRVGKHIKERQGEKLILWYQSKQLLVQYFPLISGNFCITICNYKYLPRHYKFPSHKK